MYGMPKKYLVGVRARLRVRVKAGVRVGERAELGFGFGCEMAKVTCATQ